MIGILELVDLEKLEAERVDLLPLCKLPRLLQIVRLNIPNPDHKYFTGQIV